MAIKARKTWRLGFRYLHIKINATQKGYSSWSFQVGPASWNARTRAWRVDLPGPFHWQGESRKKTGRSGAVQKRSTRKPPPDSDRVAVAVRRPTSVPAPSRSRLVEKLRGKGQAWLDRRDAERDMTPEQRKQHREELGFERALEKRRTKPAKRVRMTCVKHPVPVPFNTVAEFNEHLASHLTTERRVLPKKAKARKGRRPANRPDSNTAPGNKPDVQKDRLQTLVTAWEPHMAAIRGKAVESMNLTGAVSSIREFGETAPTGVSDLRERLMAFEQIGQALQEVMDGVEVRWAQQAHIKEDVTVELRPLAEAGEMIAAAATRTLAAFEDAYRQDIQDARAEQRVDNEFLVR